MFKTITKIINFFSPFSKIILVLALGTFAYFQAVVIPIDSSDNVKILGGGLKGGGNSIVKGEQAQNESNQLSNTAFDTTQTDNSSEFSPLVSFVKITDPSPSFENYAYISGDLIIKKDTQILRVKPNAIDSEKIRWHAIQAEDLDTSSITSRIIKDGTIQGQDISANADLAIKSLTVSGAVIINGSSTITGNMDMAGNVISNIGNSGTDFTATGGLNLADALVVAGPLQGTTLDTGQGAYELYAMDQNVLMASSPTFAGLTLNGNLILGANTLTTTNANLISNLNADLLDSQQGSYYLNTGTNFAGDISGVYSSIVIADDSHNHTATTLPATTSYLGQTIESLEITDGTIINADLASAISLLAGQTFSYGLGTLTANALDTALTYSVSISGNSATVSNGLYSNVSYSDPTWLSALAGTKINSNISTSAANVTGTVSISNGGTGQTSAQTARNALLPTQTANAGKFLQTDGTDTTWQNVLWSNLNAPTANLSLAMQSYTTTFTYGNATGAGNLFNITDTASNSGTGVLVNITTGNASLLNPFRVSGSNGVFPAIAVDSTGKVGIGWATPTSQLTVVGGATFGATYATALLSDGKVAIENNLGIGTTAPLSKLGVLGNASIGATYGAIAAPTSSLIVENKIGIGVTNPTAKLEIGGTAGVDGIKFPDGTTQTTAKPFICGSVIYDVDNNAYETVSIGTQCWMKSNLMTTKYPDGTAITRGAVDATWDGADHAYYAYPPNAANNAEESLANIISGKLGFVYQWSAVMKGSTTEGVQGVCPTGWHVPTDAQQNTLDQYLTDYGQTCNAARVNAWDCLSAGSKLSMSTLSGNNSSGFTGMLAGYRNTDGSFYGRASNALIWSSSQNSASNAWHRNLNSGYATVDRNTNAKAFGFSVRCLKD